MGRSVCPVSARMRDRVSTARCSTEVKPCEKKVPTNFFPAARASSRPSGVRGTSTSPVKRFSRFQEDCPCRTRTRRDIGYELRFAKDNRLGGLSRKKGDGEFIHCREEIVPP